MKNITLSITEEVYKEMKSHPEIKWSEVARESIKDYLKNMKTVTDTAELKANLSPKILNTLSLISEKKAKQFSKEVSKLEWSRLKSATSQLSRKDSS